MAGALALAAGAADASRHGTARRHKKLDAAGRCEAYNHLKLMLLGAWLHFVGRARYNNPIQLNLCVL